MDRTTGKTFNSAFVELALTPVDAGMVAQAKNLKVLKGRVVTVELSSQEELLRSVFPKWVGHFENGEPVNPGDLTYEGQASDGSGTTSALVPPPFVTRDEINALLVVCRNYKVNEKKKKHMLYIDKCFSIESNVLCYSYSRLDSFTFLANVPSARSRTSCPSWQSTLGTSLTVCCLCTATTSLSC